MSSNQLKFLWTTERYKVISCIIWFSIILFSFLKVYFITPVDLNNDNFLETYKYFTPDSYDWLVNGKYLFVHEDITYRQPGLPLIIKLLMSINLLGLLPLINHIVLLIFLYSTYQVSLLINPHRNRKYLALFLIYILFTNYYLQYFTNLILADIYAFTFISLAFYFLFKNQWKLSYLFLGISWLFQNFAPVLIPVFMIYSLFVQHNRKKIIIKRLTEFVVYGIVFLLPCSWWLIYKTINFGNPFYTKVAQFELLAPNFNSINYYVFNSLAIYGFILCFILIYFLVRTKDFWTNKMLISFIISIFITFIFWVVLYEWNDRRFLLYFMPFYMPLAYTSLLAINWHTVTLSFFSLILTLNTFISITPSKFERILPVAPGVEIEKMVAGELELTVRKPNLTSLPIAFFYETYVNRVALKREKNTIAHQYIEIIKQNYDPDTNILCLDFSKFQYSFYEFNNVFKYMNKGRSVLVTTIIESCYKHPNEK